jgi:hypothetical protein
MKKTGKIGRRIFLGTGLVGTGGLLGWLASGMGKSNRKARAGSDETRKLGKEFIYDVSEFEKTDPKHLLYEEGTSFPTGFEKIHRMAIAPDGRVLVAGDRAIKFFKGGTPDGQIELGRVPHCLFPTEDELFVGHHNHFKIYDYQGNLKSTSERFEGEKTYITSLALSGDRIYLADAGNREVIISDRKGNVLSRFGKKSDVNPGFAVPSPFFDLEVMADGSLSIANTGRLRVETYTAEGEFKSSWGGPGMSVDKFCGCCNPSYFTMTGEGNYITSEKGLARINVYDKNGVFKGAVAGPDMLVVDKELIKKEADNTLGAGFDVAVDSKGNVLALDPYQKVVRTFVPISEGQS